MNGDTMVINVSEIIHKKSTTQLVVEFLEGNRGKAFSCVELMESVGYIGERKKFSQILAQAMLNHREIKSAKGQSADLRASVYFWQEAITE